MELEFRSWLCICEHEFLKLLHVSLFEKLIDHNLIYDHDSIVCQELINSGILNINLAVFKLFIGDRNSFSIEKREKNSDCTNLQTLIWTQRAQSWHKTMRKCKLIYCSWPITLLKEFRLKNRRVYQIQLKTLAFRKNSVICVINHSTRQYSYKCSNKRVWQKG